MLGRIGRGPETTCWDPANDIDEERGHKSAGSLRDPLAWDKICRCLAVSAIHRRLPTIKREFTIGDA